MDKKDPHNYFIDRNLYQTNDIIPSRIVGFINAKIYFKYVNDSVVYDIDKTIFMFIKQLMEVTK